MNGQHSKGNLLTDAEGRLRIDGMVPGARDHATVRLKGKVYRDGVFEVTLKAGESWDLGDVNRRTREV